MSKVVFEDLCEVFKPFCHPVNGGKSGSIRLLNRCFYQSGFYPR